MKKFLLVTPVVMSLLSILFASHIFATSVYFTSSPSESVNAGDMYSYTVAAVSTNNYPLTYTFPNLPSWLSFNSVNNTLSGSTTIPGKYTVYITASDGHGTNDQQNYYLSVLPIPTQTITVTPTASQTATVKPTQTPFPTVTATKATTTPTPTQAPQSSAAIPADDNKIVLTNVYPKDGATITSTNTKVSGSVGTSFPVDKKVFTMFFDNVDVTMNVTLSTKTIGTNQYQSDFIYQAKNLASGTHNVNIIITNPDTITIPESWAFHVNNANGNSIIQNIFSFVGSAGIGFVILLFALLIFVIIVAKLIKQGARVSESKETLAKMPEERK